MTIVVAWLLRKFNNKHEFALISATKPQDLTDDYTVMNYYNEDYRLTRTIHFFRNTE